MAKERSPPDYRTFRTVKGSPRTETKSLEANESLIPVPTSPLKATYISFATLAIFPWMIPQILWLVVLGTWHCTGEKLSPDQKAPLFARGSGGLILNTPFEDNKARRGPASTSIGTAAVPANDEVQREETEELKLVDGQLVRTVKGSFAYKSPEGLPISVKYEADENGNRASFKFGTGEVKVGGTAGGPPRGGGGLTRGPSGGRNGGGPSKGPAGTGSKGKDYLPPKDVDRSYLPPSK